MCVLTTEICTPDRICLADLARAYSRFYGEEPWCEGVVCPVCKPVDDFGPNHAWGGKVQLVFCPECGHELQPYWSVDRLSTYFGLHDQPFGIVVWSGSEAAAWVWGYPTSSTEYYVDVVGIIEKYRKVPGTRYFLGVFRQFMANLAERGYCVVKTRTHNDAKKVRLLLHGLGFRKGSLSQEDPERSYWQANITELLA